MVHMRIGSAVLAILLCSGPALGGLFEDIYGGLQLATTPIGAPSASRFGRVAIVPNTLGQGYRLELERSFGSDGRGRPEVFDAGNFELQLSGSMLSTLQYTGRGIPTGSAEFFANGLSYALRSKTGALDVQLVGTLDVRQQVEINRLGFYALQLDVSNEDSILIANGLIAEGDRDTNFDIGPINIRGNVFFDAMLALLKGLRVDTSGLEDIFPNSPIDQITAEFDAFLAENSQVLAESLSGDLREGPLSSAAALEARELVSSAIRTIDDPEIYGPPPGESNIPEPASLLSISLFALIAARRRN